MKIRTKKGKIIKVYKHSYRNTYVDAIDCTTEYNVNEVELINK